MTSGVHPAMKNLDIPSFRIKRSHTKSRLGCFRCKQRRIKCDETHPACKQCLRRRLSCAYEGRPGSSGGSPASQSSPGSVDTAPQEFRVSETELMRHFFAHTIETFTATSIRSEHKDLWRIVIPALAYTHSPVRHGLLTAAALCLHYDSLSEPEVASRYFQTAKNIGERFVMESRAQARRFDSSEFDSILACSRILTVLGFAFYRIHRANGVILSDPAAWTWLHLLRGVKTVFTAIHQSGVSTDPLMAINMIPEMPHQPKLCGLPSNGMSWHRSHKHFALVQDTQGVRFEALFSAVHSTSSDFSNDQVQDLEAAIISLRSVTNHICTGEVHSLFRAICTWPGDMTNGFMNMLLNNEPLALVLYAHWLMLVVLANEMWWFDDMGVAGIREVVDICSCDDPSLMAMLEWPLQMLEPVGD